MEVHPSEAHLFHPEPKAKPKNAWADINWVDWLLAILIGVILGFASGCDGQAAEITAKAELDAHQQYLDTWVRFHSTTTPIRASDLGMVATACHQLQDRTWECYAK